MTVSDDYDVLIKSNAGKMMMTTLPQHNWLTVAEVAAAIRVQPCTVRQWVKNGVLDAIQPSERIIRIKRESAVAKLNLRP